MSNFSIKEIKKSNTLNIVVSENLTIDNVKEFHEKIVDAYKGIQVINLDFKKVTQLDVTGVQVIYLIKKVTGNTGVTLSITSDFDPNINTLLENNGINIIKS